MYHVYIKCLKNAKKLKGAPVNKTLIDCASIGATGKCDLYTP